jgi:hypothetical protein
MRKKHIKTELEPGEEKLVMALKRTVITNVERRQKGGKILLIVCLAYFPP